MKNYNHQSKYFCGNKISDYGLENGYVDYYTFSRAFDAVLNNNIFDVVGWEDWEPVSGFTDNSEEIEELENKIAELEELITDDSSNESDNEVIKQIEELEKQKEELEDEQYNLPECYQYYIVSDAGARLIEEYNVGVLWYCDKIDMNLWGVTHWGTSWDYVLTDIKIELEEGE